jgi:PEP-CTERM motif-containing protein
MSLREQGRKGVETMKRAIGVVAILAVASVATAAPVTVTYGWEDGVGTVLGTYGNLSESENVSGAYTGAQAGSEPAYDVAGASEGTNYLRIQESPHSSTPQAFVAWVKNLNAGDTVSAAFDGYDVTPDASPSLRIWGHYSDNVDITSYTGSAGGNYDYTAGTGWSQVAFDWTAVDGGLVIEARIYSTPSTADPATTDMFVDALSVTVNSSSPTATLVLPDGSETIVPEPATLSLLGICGLAALIRRRA